MADDILKNIPLPADLPENWTSGQIIAPNGAEVGLDDQHGYNYLMKQVNNAQKALKVLAAQREEDHAKIKFWVSPDPTSPAAMFGGTWEQIKDVFLLAAGNIYEAGTTGGEAEHTLTVAEMPSHAHNITYPASNSNAAKMAFNYTFRSGWVADSPVTSAGENEPHNNMPPYLAIYAWKRIA
jgi:hypothetical protein